MAKFALRTNLAFILGGESFTAITQDIAGMSRKQLSAHAYDLTVHRSEILGIVFS